MSVHEVFRTDAQRIVIVGAIDTAESVIDVADIAAEDEVAQQFMVFGQRHDGFEIGR